MAAAMPCMSFRVKNNSSRQPTSAAAVAAVAAAGMHPLMRAGWRVRTSDALAGVFHSA